MIDYTQATELDPKKAKLFSDLITKFSRVGILGTKSQARDMMIEKAARARSFAETEIPSIVSDFNTALGSIYQATRRAPIEPTEP